VKQSRALKFFGYQLLKLSILDILFISSSLELLLRRIKNSVLDSKLILKIEFQSVIGFLGLKMVRNYQREIGKILCVSVIYPY